MARRRAPYIGKGQLLQRRIRQIPALAGAAAEEFAQSPFVPESYLFTARDYVRLGSLDKAEETLTMILEKYPKVNSDQDVSLLLAQVALGREGRSMALDIMEKAIANVKSRERKIDLIIRTAGIAMSLRQYDKAIALLKNCPRDNKYPDKLYLTDLTLVSCYEAKDSLPAAMRLTNRMLGNKLYGDFFPYILLKKGSIFSRMNKIDDAINAYLSLTDAYAPPPPAPAAPATPAPVAPKGRAVPDSISHRPPVPAQSAAPAPQPTTASAPASGQHSALSAAAAAAGLASRGHGAHGAGNDLPNEKRRFCQGAAILFMGHVGRPGHRHPRKCNPAGKNHRLAVCVSGTEGHGGYFQNSNTQAFDRF